MALNIRNPLAERLSTELAELTGETKTDAVITALSDRLARVRRDKGKKSLREELEEIADRCSRLPILDPRTPDEILGYDENGLPS